MLERTEVSTGTAMSRAARASGANSSRRYAAAPLSRLRWYAGTASNNYEGGRRRELQTAAQRAAAQRTVIRAAAEQPTAQRDAVMRAGRDTPSPAADSAAATTTTPTYQHHYHRTHYHHHWHRHLHLPTTNAVTVTNVTTTTAPGHPHHQPFATTTTNNPTTTYGCYPSAPTTPAHIAQGRGITSVG